MTREEEFRANPMIAGYLATALQDLQYSEIEERDERDTGTIYTAPDCTFLFAKRECEAFLQSAPDDALSIAIESLGKEHIGSDLYLERAGHGAGFRDRTYFRDDEETVGERLSAAVSSRGTVEIYLGDDGEPYFVGGESVL